jgi:putative chitinase
MPLIESVLRAVAPGANAGFVAASKDAGAIMARYGINSAVAQAELIAQMAHESTGFKSFEEGLSYSAQRLTKVWPSRFPTLAAAQPYAKNPKALANKVYNGRMGNRPNSDDGYDYRGSDPLQHTGRTEFERVERRTGLKVVATPNLLRDPRRGDVAWAAACSYFVDRGALPFAEHGDTKAVTVKVNGGTIGLSDRLIMKKRVVSALGGVPITTTSAQRTDQVEKTETKVIVTDKTTAEQSDETKKRATQTTVGAPAGGATSGGATQQSGADWALIIGVGVTVAVVVGVIAIVLWRKHFAVKASLETMTLEAVKARAETP